MVISDIFNKIFMKCFGWSIDGIYAKRLKDELEKADWNECVHRAEYFFKNNMPLCAFYCMRKADEKGDDNDHIDFLESKLEIGTMYKYQAFRSRNQRKKKFFYDLSMSYYDQYLTRSELLNLRLSSYKTAVDRQIDNFKNLNMLEEAAALSNSYSEYVCLTINKKPAN